MTRQRNGVRSPRQTHPARSRTLTRRHIVAGALGAAGASALSAGLVRPGGGIAELAGLAAQGPGIELPKILELRSENGLRTVDLFARPLVEGGNALGYALCADRDDPACAPLIPGPTLRLFRGDRLRLRLVNELGAVTTNLHVHGLHVTPRAT